MHINNKIKLKIIDFIHGHCYPAIFKKGTHNSYEYYINSIEIINKNILLIINANNCDDIKKVLIDLNSYVESSELILRKTGFNFDIFFEDSLPFTTNFQDYFFLRHYKKALLISKIGENEFNDLNNLANHYGFKGLVLTNKASKICKSIYIKTEKALKKLREYLNIIDSKEIGHELLLKLHGDNELYSGTFNYADNYFANSGSITLCISKNQKNFSLFRTLLHEYIHYIDFKIGEKLTKVLSSNQNNGILFSELSVFDKRFFPYVNNLYNQIFNHNLNNNVLEEINYLYEKDYLFFIDLLKSENIKEPEVFAKKYIKSFSYCLNFIGKIYDYDNKDNVNNFNNIDYFLNSMPKWKHKQFKKHFLLIKMGILFNTSNAKDTLYKLGFFDKRSYVRLREKHYTHDLFIRVPTLFKCSIGHSGMSKYLKRNSEMLAWSLTGGLNLYKTYNKKAAQDLYQLISKDIINLRYQKKFEGNNHKTTSDRVIELFNVFSFRYDVFRKIN